PREERVVGSDTGNPCSRSGGPACVLVTRREDLTNCLAQLAVHQRRLALPLRIPRVGDGFHADDTVLKIDGYRAPGPSAEYERELREILLRDEVGFELAKLLRAPEHRHLLGRGKHAVQLKEVPPAVELLAAGAKGQAAVIPCNDRLA